MMELRIINPKEDWFIKEILWNHEELKQELAERTQKYQNLLLTNDDIDYGKKERAELRKFKDAMEAGRKDVKARCLAPYQRFEAQLKEVMAPVDSAIQQLDRQVKEFETEKRVEKMNQIRDLYDAQIGTLRGILPFDRVLKKQWLNVSTSLKSVKAEIETLVTRVNNDLDTIENLGSRYDAQIRDAYVRTLDLSIALQEKNRLEEQEQSLAERRAAKEAEQAKAREQEAQRAAALERERQAYLETKGGTAKAVQTPPTEVQAAAETTVIAPAAGPTYMVGLEVYGSREQLEIFQAFLHENDIFYRVVAKARKISEGGVNGWQ